MRLVQHFVVNIS